MRVGAVVFGLHYVVLLIQILSVFSRTILLDSFQLAVIKLLLLGLLRQDEAILMLGALWSRLADFLCLEGRYLFSVVKELIGHFEILTHFFEKVLGYCDGLVDGYVIMPWLNMRLDPLRQLLLFGRARISLVCKNHETIIIFRSQNSTYALTGLSESVEGEEVVFPDIEIIL